MQIKITVTALQHFAEMQCYVIWQHECFCFLLLVLQIVSAVAKLFLRCFNNCPRSKDIERLKKMGVVTKHP